MSMEYWIIKEITRNLERLEILSEGWKSFQFLKDYKTVLNHIVIADLRHNKSWKK